MQWKSIFRYRIKKVGRSEGRRWKKVQKRSEKDLPQQHQNIYSFKMCVRTVNGSEQLSYWCSSTLIFLECSSMLNAANAFLSYTWLAKCFFPIFFYIQTIFLFCRLFDNVLMKTYGCRNHKEAFKETKICGGIAKKWILFI